MVDAALTTNWSDQKLAILQNAVIGTYLVSAVNFLNTADLIRDGLISPWDDCEGIRVSATDAGRVLAQQLSLVTLEANGRFDFGPRMPVGDRIFPD